MASAIERQLKRLGLFGLAKLATPPRSAPAEADLARVRRILVVRPDERIGNAILIIPLLAALRKRLPSAHLWLIMSRRYWDLREFIPDVDEFVPFDKKHYARNPIAFFGFIRRLRRGNYDLVFDASGDHSVSFTHLAITAYSGGRFRIGHDRGDASKCYEVAVQAPPADRHETERHLDLLRAIAAVEQSPRPLLKPTPDSGYAAQLWSELRWTTDCKTVIIHPGARGRKRWPAQNFAAIANRLAHDQYQVGVVWGPADETAATEMLKDSTEHVKKMGQLDFRDFVSAIRASDVFLSGDCGPMHLAAAAPSKGGVVTVFVIDKKNRYNPLGPRDVAIIADTDHPPVEEVLSAINRIAQAETESPPVRSVTA